MDQNQILGWLVSDAEGNDDFVNNPTALTGRHYKGGEPIPLGAQTASSTTLGEPISLLQRQEMKLLRAPRSSFDVDGRNQMVRTFLMIYGTPGLTIGVMKKHMAMSGCQIWPQFVEHAHNDEHLTIAGAELWLRTLFLVEKAATPMQPAQEPRWYCIDKTGIATLCADEDDAKQRAKLAEKDWPSRALYGVFQLCEYTPPVAQPAQDWKTLPKKDAPLVEWANEQTPPKRPWVGLTDEEQMALLKDSDGKTRHWLVWEVEAKLKEKNNG